jgi:Ca-activated chloride channel family protein
MTARGADQVLEIVAPRHLSTAIGESFIELRVAPPPGVKVLRIEISVDGVPLIALDAPPWRTGWDAGDGSRGRRVEAVAHLSNGTREVALVRTSPLRINQVEEVGLVNLYPVVRSPEGSYVADLGKQDFRILEDGVPQQVIRFTTERRPLRIGIVLDTSLTMEGRKLENAKSAALEFLDILEPGDEGMVVAFNDEVRILQEITAERRSMAQAISGVDSRGGTALYDAVWRTAKKLEEFDGRRVLVLLSDGRDEAANGFEPGSLHTLEEALTQALRSEVMLFAIGLGRNLDEQLDFTRRFTLEAVLKRLASETGGRALFTPGAGRLRRAFSEVADDLRNQYSIAYRSTNETRDGKWRRIRLDTPGRDLEITCRAGYFASSDDGPPGAP